MGKSLPVDLCSGSGGTAGSDINFFSNFSERPILPSLPVLLENSLQVETGEVPDSTGPDYHDYGDEGVLCHCLGSNRFLVTGSPMYLCQLTGHVG